MTRKNGWEYIHIRDLFKSSVSTSIGENVQKAVQEEKRQSILDESLLRRQQDWSFLAQQVVGGEDWTRPR